MAREAREKSNEIRHRSVASRRRMWVELGVEFKSEAPFHSKCGCRPPPVVPLYDLETWVTGRS